MKWCEDLRGVRTCVAWFVSQYWQPALDQPSPTACRIDMFRLYTPSHESLHLSKHLREIIHGTLARASGQKIARPRPRIQNKQHEERKGIMEQTSTLWVTRGKKKRTQDQDNNGKTEPSHTSIVKLTSLKNGTPWRSDPHERSSFLQEVSVMGCQ